MAEGPYASNLSQTAKVTHGNCHKKIFFKVSFSLLNMKEVKQFF